METDYHLPVGYRAHPAERERLLQHLRGNRDGEDGVDVLQ